MEKRYLNKINIKLYCFTFCLLFTSVFAQKSNKNKKDDNISRYNLVAFSRPLAKDSIKITTFVEVPFSSLQFVKKGNQFLASYDVTVIAQNNEGFQIKRKIWSDSIKVSSYIETKSKIRSKKYFTNIKVGKEKYTIISEVYDKDTRNKGTQRKNLNFSKNKKVPSLMEPIAIINLDGNWGFKNNEFPILGKSMRYLDRDLYLLVSGFINPGNYSLSVFANSNILSKEYVVDILTDHSGFFVHRVKIDKDYMQSFSVDFEVVLNQSKHVKKNNKKITMYRPGMVSQLGNIEKSLRQMKYILTNKEQKKLKGIKGKELEDLFLKFWKERDPTPETNQNEIMEEYYARIRYVNDYYNMSWKEGWETDMGMIFILFGSPDNVQSTNPNNLNTTIFQIWNYDRLNKQFIFKDQNGFGDFRLDTPFMGTNYY